MSRVRAIRGRLVSPRTVELDEPVRSSSGEVEVLVEVAEEAKPSSEISNLADFLESLPPGTRSKEDIDRQIREERDSWD